jgi:VanZ family protein
VSARTAWAVAFGCALVVQCWALYTPSPPSASTGLPLDKAVHLLLFAGVGLLGALAGIPARWLLLGLVLQAVLSELAQGAWLSERGADGWDVVADLVGAILGVAIGVRLARRSSGRNVSQQT